MKCIVENRGRIDILRLEGELDLAAVEDFEQAINRLIDNGARDLMVDCSGLTSLTSSGLRVFLQAHRRSAGQGGRLIVFSLGDEVYHSFEEIGLTIILRIFESEDDALRSLDVTGLLPRLR